MSIQRVPFGVTPSGQIAELFILENSSGLRVDVLDYGATIKALYVPDRRGNAVNIVLGYEDLQGYIADKVYVGGTIGRFCNRIANGRFALNGNEYQLSTNEGKHHLHGGAEGFNKKYWLLSSLDDGDEPALTLHYHSAEGEEGYPGNVDVWVSYSLREAGRLHIGYEARADKTTPVNLTNHASFNLSGQHDRQITDHVLQLDADYFSPVDSSLIPLGTSANVEGTQMDFRKPTAIGARIDQDFQQLRYGDGYDHNWILNKPAGDLGWAASVHSEASGIEVRVHTTQPCLQFYSGNHLAGDFRRRCGFCLETQHIPNSLNQPGSSGVLLLPGECYRQETVFEFPRETI